MSSVFNHLWQQKNSSDEISSASNTKQLFSLLLGSLGPLHRQKVSVHRYVLHPRTYLNRNRSQNEDAKNHRHPSRLFAFCPQVQSLWEATQKHERALVTMLPVSAVNFLHNVSVKLIQISLVLVMLKLAMLSPSANVAHSQRPWNSTC